MYWIILEFFPLFKKRFFLCYLMTTHRIYSFIPDPHPHPVSMEVVGARFNGWAEPPLKEPTTYLYTGLVQEVE
jgi:hypothetical protein